VASLSFLPISAGVAGRLVFRPIYPQIVVIPPVVPEVTTGGGTSKRDRQRKRVIRFSELDERQRREALATALAAIAVRPFTPLEDAANTVAYSGGPLWDAENLANQNQEDDILILLTLARILH